MKTAVRTSALSTRWRDLWTSILNLDFDCEFWNSSQDNGSEHEGRVRRKRDEFARIVGRFLEQHKGPKVKRLRLYFYPGNEYGRQTVQWLKLAVEKGVEELDLDLHMESGKLFDLPTFVLQCRSLLSLGLTYSNIKLPPECKCSCSLKIIYLNQVEISDDVVEWMFSHCQQLERLYLIECSKLQHAKMSSPAPRLKYLKAVNNTSVLESIEIDAPNLSTFLYTGHPIHFLLKDVTGLQSAVLNTVGEEDQQVTVHKDDPRLLLSRLCRVKTLHLSSCFLQVVFAGRHTHSDLPTMVKLHNLKELRLSIEAIRSRRVSTITYLLSMCPVLEKLFIDADAYRPTHPWEWEIFHLEPEIDVFMDHLKLFEFTGFTAAMWERELVKVLLSSSPMLQSLVLVHPPAYDMVEHILGNVMLASEKCLEVEYEGDEVPPSLVTNLLMDFPRASPELNILLLPDQTHAELHATFSIP